MNAHTQLAAQIAAAVDLQIAPRVERDQDVAGDDASYFWTVDLEQRDTDDEPFDDATTRVLVWNPTPALAAAIAHQAVAEVEQQRWAAQRRSSERQPARDSVAFGR